MNKEIKGRTDRNQLQGRIDRFARGIARSSEMVLTELEENPDRPNNLDYFIDLMRDVFVRNRWAERFMQYADNKKIIGIYCMMVPEEIIYAAGAIPVRFSGGSYEASCVGDEHVPRDTCPVVKASVGSMYMGYPSPCEICDVLIVPTTCDAKRKMGEELSRHKEVWMLEVPHIKDNEDSKRKWLQQLYGLKRNIEKYTGRGFIGSKIGRKELDASIRVIGRAQYEARRLYEIRKSPMPVVSGREAALVFNAYCYDTAPEWTKAISRLNDELETRCRNGFSVCKKDIPRILLAGCPSVFPNWKIPFLIEEMGAVIVADESCTGDRYLYDPVGVTEKTMTGMMTGIAARYLMPCVCPSFAPNEDRLYRLLQMSEEFGVDGIIYHVLKGCVIYDFELIRVEKTLKEKDIPVLRIETDYNPEDIEQLRTRIEAFVEMLVTKKTKT